MYGVHAIALWQAWGKRGESALLKSDLPYEVELGHILAEARSSHTGLACSEQTSREL